MSTAIKNVSFSWTWTGDESVLVGFNVALCLQGETPLTSSVASAFVPMRNTENQTGELTGSYTFRNVLVDLGATYITYAQSVFPGSDSPWLASTGVVISDDGAATVATSQQISDIKIGGRNLFKQTTSITSVDGGLSSCPARSASGFTLYGRNTDNGIMRVNGLFDSNGMYTIGFDVQCDFGAYPCSLDFCDTGNFTFTTTPAIQHYEHTFTISNYTADVYNFIDFNLLSAQNIRFTNFKVEKGNIATAWSPAPEDVQAQFDTIASDSILSRGEKSNLNAVEAGISAEWQALEAKADYLGVSHVAYTAALDYLRAWETTHSTWADTTVDTPLVGLGGLTPAQYFTKAWGDVTAEKTKLQNTMADKASTMASGLKIGGRNLLRGSAATEVGSWIAEGVDTPANGPPSFYLQLTGTSESFIWTPTTAVVPLQSYIFSCQLRVDTNCAGCEIYSMLGQNNYNTIVRHGSFGISDTTFRKIQFTFTAAEGQTTVAFRIDNNGSTNGQPAAVYVGEAKLEEGNIDTAWTEAPEDTQARLDAAQQTATTAINALADIAADNKITQGEKAAIFAKFKELGDSGGPLYNQATALGITTIRDAFAGGSGAVDVLITYMNSTFGLSGYTNEIGIAWSANTDTITIPDVLDFNNKFTNAYNTRQALTVEIARVSSTMANWGGVGDRPTSLVTLNTTDGNKLAGIAAGATVGATIGTDLSGKMTRDNISVWIDDLAVDTLQIGLNAVTVPYSGIKTTNTVISSVDVWYTILTTPLLDFYGQPVAIIISSESILLSSMGNSTNYIDFRVYSDNLELWTKTFSFYSVDTVKNYERVSLLGKFTGIDANCVYEIQIRVRGVKADSSKTDYIKPTDILLIGCKR